MLKKIVIFISVFLVVFLFLCITSRHHKLENPQPPITIDAREKPQVAVITPEKPKIPEPDWIIYKAKRQGSGRGRILVDVDSHIANNIYRDEGYVTWAHETSHGIASDIRNKFNARCGLYALRDRAIIIREPPNVKLVDIAARIPAQYRGSSFNLYFGQQLRDWNNWPLYVLDEWVAYTDGAAVRAELGIRERGDTVTSMVEFNTYVLFLATSFKVDDPQFRKFVIWNSIRVKQIYESNKRIGGIAGAEAYVNRLRYVQNTSKSYFAEYWQETIFGEEEKATNPTPTRLSIRRPKMPH